MAMEYRSGICTQCDGQRKVERSQINDVFHLLVTIVTVGLWIPVWILASIRLKGWRCATCGGADVTDIR